MKHPLALTAGYAITLLLTAVFIVTLLLTGAAYLARPPKAGCADWVEDKIAALRALKPGPEAAFLRYNASCPSQFEWVKP